MKKSITVVLFLLSLAGLVVSGQSLAADNDVKAEIVKQCQAEAQGAIDPEIIAQECIEQKLQELSGEKKAKEES